MPICVDIVYCINTDTVNGQYLPGDDMTDYIELARLADRVFAISEDDPKRLAEILLTLEDDLRSELIHSDFLNAFQVFYFFFSEEPTELGEERLILQPATAAKKGVLIEERGFFELFFVLDGDEPAIFVSDGEQVLKKFTGRSAYSDAVNYAEEYD